MLDRFQSRDWVDVSSGACSHCPTAQRVIWRFLPLGGKMGWNIGKTGTKEGEFCEFSPTCEHRRLGRIFCSIRMGKRALFRRQSSRINGHYLWKLIPIARAASVTASQVAYCDARNHLLAQDARADFTESFGNHLPVSLDASVNGTVAASQQMAS